MTPTETPFPGTFRRWGRSAQRIRRPTTPCQLANAGWHAGWRPARAPVTGTCAVHRAVSVVWGLGVTICLRREARGHACELCVPLYLAELVGSVPRLVLVSCFACRAVCCVSGIRVVLGLVCARARKPSLSGAYLFTSAFGGQSRGVQPVVCVCVCVFMCERGATRLLWVCLHPVSLR